MKLIFQRIFSVLVYLSVFVLAVNTIGSIAHGVYLWGGEGIELSVAAWTALKYWLIIGITAFIVLVISMTGGIMLEDRPRNRFGL